MKLHRTVATYEACSPEEVASGSTAQMMNFVADAQRDIGALADANADLLAVLRQQKAWVNHWIDDRAHGLGPTEGSLRDALAEIDTALTKAGA